MKGAVQNIELSIIVFAHNEADNVQPVLEELMLWLSQHESRSEVIFVDDGSDDQSEARARETLASFPHRIIRHTQRAGIGAALKSGVDLARGRWVTFLPADGQIPPAAIGILRAAQRETQAEVVFSVYPERQGGAHRVVMSNAVRSLIWLLHGVRVRSDGPYLFPRSLFRREELPSDSFFLNFEFPIRVRLAGLPSTTVEVECRPRRAGHSKSARLDVIARVSKELVALRLRRWEEQRAFWQGTPH